MRVLVAHNLYRSATPSGENLLVRAEIGLLRDGGVHVVEMLESSDSIPSGVTGVVRAAPGPLYSRAGVRRFERLLATSRPDVVHLHQVQPLISPWVIRVAARTGVPVVQTVHAYRHGCANGLHLRDGKVCTDCVGTKLGLPAVQHGCYRGSRVQTVPVSLGMVAHRRTWREGVARYLALTPFMRDMLVSSGLPAQRITIRPTWVADPGEVTEPGRDVLFVGRLDVPKGVDRLLDAWAAGGRNSGRRLRIVGDGPLAGRVANDAARDDTVEHLGLLDQERVRDAMRQAAYVVVASRFFEGYPLVVAEAFAAGRPVLTVAGGSVGSIVGDEGGWTVEPTTEAITRALVSITDDDVRRQSVLARRRYERDNTPRRGLESLLSTYADVVR
jgi:glycosyltransferase involved in cell wall biosynthesis